MPYQVIELEEPSNDFQDELNAMERNGWTLVHILQGFSTAGQSLGDGEVQTVMWKPRFIFHRPEEPESPAPFSL